MTAVPPPAATPSPPPPLLGKPAGDLPAEVPPRWPLWFAPGAIVLGFGVGLVATIVVDVAGSGGHDTSHLTVAQTLLGNVLFDLGFVGAALYFVSLRTRPRPRDFGFRRIPLATAVVALVAAAAGYYLLSLAYSALLSLHGTDRLPAPLGTTQSTVALAGVAVFVCVFAPLAEEFFFRGFLFGVLRQMRVVVAGREVGAWVAAVIVGILFGLAHAGSALSQDLIPLGFLGFVLCLVRWRTGSLYPCMALHALNNALALGITQFHWNGGEIVGLMAGSLVVIGLITLPLSGRPTEV
jgi:membrane protease YdiL (CAAX protease family)